VHTLTGHSRAVVSVAFSPNGNLVVSGSHDDLVKIWDTQTGVQVSSHACTWWSVELDWVSRGVKAVVLVVDTFWISSALNSTGAHADGALECRGPSGSLGFKCSHHSPTTRPSVERTAEKAFLLSGRVKLSSVQARAEGIKGGSLGVGEGIPTGSHG
jgi:WD40 repeat protein